MRTLRVYAAAAGWWAALAGLWLGGAVVGMSSGFFAEYTIGSRIQVFGVPIPAGFALWLGSPGQEQWVGVVTDSPLLFAAANVPLVMLLAGSLVGPVFWVWRKRRACRCP